MNSQLPELNYATPFSAAIHSGDVTYENPIMESIDATLSLVGDANKRAIYKHIENIYGIKKEEISYKIVEFTRAFEQMLGLAAKLIEMKTMERLHNKYKDFSYIPMKGELDFLEFISNFSKVFGELNYG